MMILERIEDIYKLSGDENKLIDMQKRKLKLQISMKIKVITNF